MTEEQTEGSEEYQAAMMDALGRAMQEVEETETVAHATDVGGTLTLEDGRQVQVFVEAALFDPDLFERAPETGGLLKYEVLGPPGEEMIGTLVRLPGGRAWDLLVEDGPGRARHAGMEQIFQRYRRKRVRIVIEEVPEGDELETVVATVEAPDDVCEALDAVGPVLAEALWKAGFETVSDLAGAADEDLLAVPGLGDKTLEQIRAELEG